MKLAAIRIVKSELALDKLFRGPNSPGLFSTSTAIQLQRTMLLEPAIPLWRLIWKANAQQRIRQFMYLVAHNGFLCNTNRVRRHFANDAACPRCQGEESPFHLLRDCSVIRDIWLALAGNRLPNSFFTEDNIQFWLAMNLNQGHDWGSMFAHMLWYTWKVRNDLVFKGAVISGGYAKGTLCLVQAEVSFTTER